MSGRGDVPLTMSLPKLYLETTIPSYLTARRSANLRIAADQQTTELWWESGRHEYDLFTSAVVIAEVSLGDAEMIAARLRVLGDVPRLERTPAVGLLTSELLRREIVPENAAADAAHIAFAAVHAMDFLLTWNCKHINNPHLIRRIEALCAEQDVKCPVICTPEELLPPSHDENT